ncbi:hypothetical protein [Streptomyces sp. bgisy095]|uniref:hypothetical protein n=1 Tax=unclassified Streptomyces TaxID=2593676 RepID=UPI003D73B0FF
MRIRLAVLHTALLITAAVTTAVTALGTPSTGGTAAAEQVRTVAGDTPWPQPTPSPAPAGDTPWPGGGGQ